MQLPSWTGGVPASAGVVEVFRHCEQKQSPRTLGRKATMQRPLRAGWLSGLGTTNKNRHRESLGRKATETRHFVQFKMNNPHPLNHPVSPKRLPPLLSRRGTKRQLPSWTGGVPASGGVVERVRYHKQEQTPRKFGTQSDDDATLRTVQNEQSPPFQPPRQPKAAATPPVQEGNQATIPLLDRRGARFGRGG